MREGWAVHWCNKRTVNSCPKPSLIICLCWSAALMHGTYAILLWSQLNRGDFFGQSAPKDVLGQECVERVMKALDLYHPAKDFI